MVDWDPGRRQEGGAAAASCDGKSIGFCDGHTCVWIDLVGPPSYMRSVIDRNVSMQCMTVYISI